MKKNKVLDLELYKQKLLSKDKKSFSSQEFEAATKITPEQLQWFSFCSTFCGIELFLTELFFHNHEVRSGRNMDSAFIMAFTEQHLYDIEESVIETLKKCDRGFILIDARDKSFIQIAEEALNVSFKTNYDAFIEFEKLLTSTDKVIIITAPSLSKKSFSSGFLRDLVKCREDTRIPEPYPSSDLIFIDYATFLQKTWPLIGEYIKPYSYK